MANDYGLIYIGTIVKAIIDLLSTQFGGLSSSAIGNEILDRKIKEGHYSILCHTDIEEMSELSK